jgi:hypothetical protein
MKLETGFFHVDKEYAKEAQYIGMCSAGAIKRSNLPTLT